MDDRQIRIEDKVDKIIDKIGSIDVTLAAQHVSLTDHIRRTELLEKEIEPIKKHVSMVHGAMKLIGLGTVLASVVEAILSIMSHLKG